MASMVTNIFAGLGLSLVFPLVLFVILSIFLAITSGK